MKFFITIICMVLLTLYAALAYAQNNRITKSLLFGNLPATIKCTEAQLNNLFSAQKGQIINMELADNFMLSGPVTDKLAKFSNLETIVIKLSTFKNTLFSLSKQTDQNNKNIYVGKILNPLYADGYELKRGVQGSYQLNKIDLEKILVNCNQ